LSGALAPRFLRLRKAQSGSSTGSPMLYVERDYLHKKAMTLRSVGYYRTDLFSYELTLKRRNR
jgi:hypothetical protein